MRRRRRVVVVVAVVVVAVVGGADDGVRPPPPRRVLHRRVHLRPSQAKKVIYVRKPWLGGAGNKKILILFHEIIMQSKMSYEAVTVTSYDPTKLIEVSPRSVFVNGHSR